MQTNSFLDRIARRTALDIVDLYADTGVPDRQGLVEAIARLARLGLDGHVRLFETQQSLPAAAGSLENGDRSL
jgi:hypothetical protein